MNPVSCDVTLVLRVRTVAGRASRRRVPPEEVIGWLVGPAAASRLPGVPFSFGGTSAPTFNLETGSLRVRPNSLGQSTVNGAITELRSHRESQMEDNQIDSLAKQLATAPSRRALLRLTASGALGALVGGLGLGAPISGLFAPRSAEAAKKNRKV